MKELKGITRLLLHPFMHTLEWAEKLYQFYVAWWYSDKKIFKNVFVQQA